MKTFNVPPILPSVKTKWYQSLLDALRPALDAVKAVWGWVVLGLAIAVGVLFLIPKKPRTNDSGLTSSATINSGNDEKIKENTKEAEKLNDKAKKQKAGQPTPSSFEEADAALEKALKKAQKVKIDVKPKKGKK